ncbi:MAG: LysR family transcriptional regulator [Lachnospiraceae bacterium]
MEIRNLLTFIKVAEQQSLSKAAKQLGYAQSTVTMQMQQLEQELGVALYERVGKQIRMTEHGQELLGYAGQIVKTSQEALRIGKGERKQIDGTLRLGVADTMPDSEMAEWIHSYRQAYPAVHLRMQSADSQTLMRMLLHNEIDLMMIMDYRIQDAALIHACDWQEPVHFFAVPGHPLGQMEDVRLDDILKYDLIRGNPGISYEKNLETVMAEAGLMAAGSMEIENLNLAIRLVRMGEGITLLPDVLVQDDIQERRLEWINYRLPGNEIWQQTIYHKNKWLTGAMNAWIKMLEDTKDAGSLV